MNEGSEVTLSIVLPAWNEARRIGRTLDRVGEWLAAQPFAGEVIVSDDGSADETQAVCEAARERLPGLRILRHDPNHGKGYAVRQGVLAARGRFVLYTDADLSTPIEDFERLRPHLENGCGMAIGSRRLKESAIEAAQPFHRRLMGWTWSRVPRLLLGVPVQDTQCGFKAWTRDAARAIFARQRLDGFAFDVETILIAKELGIGIAEVPVRWRDDRGSKVSVVMDPLRMLRDALKLRLSGRRA